MKKLLKHMSKVLSIFLLLYSVGMQPSEYSKVITSLFHDAIDAMMPEKALRMLNDPETVSCIDVNARDKCGRTALMLACYFEYQRVIEKLLELKKSDGSLLVDINARGRDDMLANQEKFERLCGSLFADIDARNCGWQTALEKACIRRHLGIIKSLLVHGADTTIVSKVRKVKNLHDLRESLAKKNILSVFDALKPGIKDAQGTFLEASIVEAYGQFLQGNHTELRNLLLVAPDAVQRRISDGTEERKRCVGYRDTLIRSMKSVFKKESIKPLLYFLAEKQYQRNIAEVLVDRIQPGLEDNFPVDHLWYNQ